MPDAGDNALSALQSRAAELRSDRHVLRMRSQRSWARAGPAAERAAQLRRMQSQALPRQACPVSHARPPQRDQAREPSKP